MKICATIQHKEDSFEIERPTDSNVSLTTGSENINLNINRDNLDLESRSQYER